MHDPASNAAPPAREEADDLTRRIARYRKRLQAEGRVNAVKTLDNSIGPAAAPTDPGSRAKP